MIKNSGRIWNYKKIVKVAILLRNELIVWYEIIITILKNKLYGKSLQKLPELWDADEQDPAHGGTKCWWQQINIIAVIAIKMENLLAIARCKKCRNFAKAS